MTWKLSFDHHYLGIVDISLSLTAFFCLLFTSLPSMDIGYVMFHVHMSLDCICIAFVCSHRFTSTHREYPLHTNQ